MPPLLFHLLFLGLFSFCLLLQGVQAQGPATSEGPGRMRAEAIKEDAPMLKIRQAPLDVVVAVSADGSRQFHLPGWPLEALDNISNLLRKERQAPNPPFILQEIAVTGKVVENRVESEVRIVLTSARNRSVLVPIGMKEGVLFFPDNSTSDSEQKPYRYRGPGSMNMTVDSQNGQYLLLVHPPPQEPASNASPNGEAAKPDSMNPPNDLRHEITLTLWFPLTRIGGDENRLAVSFPQSLGSQFVLTVPMADAVATVTQGALLDSPPPNEPAEAKATRFRMLGLKPDFEMTWRRKKTEVVDEQPVLSVEEALIIARMETKSTVYDVSLPIRSRTVGFERIQVRLPQGTTLDHESTERYASLGGYSFEVLGKEERPAATPANEPLEGVAQPAPARILEIRLPRKTLGPVTVRFKAIQQEELEPGGWRNLGGFEVLDAARQTGQLGAIIPPNVRPNWSPVRGIRRSETASSTPQDGVDARFDFFSQSFLLRCKFAAPQTKINVQPEYQVRINKGSLDLTARFSYVVFGSKAEKLTIDLPEWQWSNEISSAGIVDTVGVEQDENGLLTIPLRAPMDGQFEIELKAFRPLAFSDEGRHRLVVPLPRPKADWIKQAAVVVVPADNVEVVPVDEDFEVVTPSQPQSSQRTQNLSRRSRRALPITLETPSRQQEPLFYETEPGGSVFVADIQYHRQKIAATQLTEIRLGTGEHVTQFVSYDVAYVPVERLYFLVPKMLEDGTSEGRLTARVGGKTLELRDVLPGPNETVPDNWSKKMLQLPEAMFRFQVIFDYAIPPVTIEHDLTTPFSLSFIRPIETQVTDHRVHMTVPTGFRIELDDDARMEWLSNEEASFTGTGFRSSQAPGRISLWISTGERDALGTTVVERAWLQTWLYGSLREDRGVYDVTSDRLKSITLWLPPEAVKGRVFVRRDSVPILPELSPSGELTVPLADNRGAPVRIEVIYRIAPFEISNRALELDLPHFGPALVRSQHWQIILPQNRHIIGVPTGWTPEYEWAWTNGLFWGRVPSLTRSDAGFEDDPTVVIPTESNQYLYSSLHPPAIASIRILDRSLIILFSSGLALVIGLTLIYFPKTRYAGSLFGLAVALLAMMLYRPAPVLLMLQASSLGVLLALVACYVHRILNRDEKWVVPKARAWEAPSQPAEIYSVIMDDESSGDSAEAPRNEGEGT